MNYRQFRITLAKEGLRELAQTLSGFGKIVIPVIGAGIPAILALLAVPSLYAATADLPTAIATVLVHTFLTIAPYLLLRKTLQPEEVATWTSRFPLSARDRWMGHIEATKFIGISILSANAISVALWAFGSPRWMIGHWTFGIVNLAIVQVVAFAVGTLAMEFRFVPKAEKVTVDPTWRASARWPKWRIVWPVLGLALFRRGYRATVAKVALMTTASLVSLPAMASPNLTNSDERLGFSFVFALLVVISTALLDANVKTRLTSLKVQIDSWPISPRSINIAAAIIPSAPVVTALVGMATMGVVSSSTRVEVLAVYAGVLLGCMSMLIGASKPSTDGRMALMIITIAFLSAIGSEIWK